MSKIFIIVREYKSDLIILYRIICTYYTTRERRPNRWRGGEGSRRYGTEWAGRTFSDIFLDTYSLRYAGARSFLRFVIVVVVIVIVVVVVVRRAFKTPRFRGTTSRRDRSVRKKAEGGRERRPIIHIIAKCHENDDSSRTRCRHAAAFAAAHMLATGSD